CDADLTSLHSFPTRRSSDLRSAHRLVNQSVSCLVVNEQLGLRIKFERPAKTQCDQSHIDNRTRPVTILLIKCKFLTCFHGVHKRSEEHTSELQSRENLVCRL